jgi:hypothetical protein
MRFKNFIPFFLFFFSLIETYSQVQQEWVRDIHNSRAGGGIVYDTSGFIVVFGSTQLMDAPPGTEVMKYATSGTQLWEKACYGWNCGLSIDSSHSTYIASYTYYSWSAPKQKNLIKYNAAGTEIWRINDTLFREPDRLISMKGDYAGNSYMLMYRDSLFELTKYNSSGTNEWVKYFSGPGCNNNIPFALTLDKSGNAIIIGECVSENNSSYYLVKYNSSGVFQWSSQYIPQSHPNYFSMDVTADTQGDIFTAFVLRDSTNVSHLVINKYNQSGILQWTRTYGQPVSADQVRIVTDISGSVISSIYYTGIIKYSSSGVFKWNLNMNATSFTVDKNLDIYCTTSPSYNSYSLYKYSSSGIYQWVTTYTVGSNCNYLNIAGIVLDTSFNIYINGGYSYLGYPLFWWPATITAKYNQLVGISNSGSEVPQEFHLFQNYPNPFNPVTTINYDLPAAGVVRLVVYDILGKEIDMLINEKQTAGKYKVTWDASNYPSGVYFYKLVVSGAEPLTTPDYTNTKKMILIK